MLPSICLIPLPKLSEFAHIMNRLHVSLCILLRLYGRPFGLRRHPGCFCSGNRSYSTGLERRRRKSVVKSTLERQPLLEILPPPTELHALSAHTPGLDAMGLAAAALFADQELPVLANLHPGGGRKLG